MFVFLENLIPKEECPWQLFYMLTMLIPLETRSFVLPKKKKKDIYTVFKIFL